jgi:hypothetical protein
MIYELPGRFPLIEAGRAFCSYACKALGARPVSAAIANARVAKPKYVILHRHVISRLCWSFLQQPKCLAVIAIEERTKSPKKREAFSVSRTASDKTDKKPARRCGGAGHSKFLHVASGACANRGKKIAAQGFLSVVRNGLVRQRSIPADTVLVTFAKTKVTRPPRGHERAYCQSKPMRLRVTQPIQALSTRLK